MQSTKLKLKMQIIELALKSEIEDEGTNAIKNDYFREQEKLVWMYSANYNK